MKSAELPPFNVHTHRMPVLPGSAIVQFDPTEHTSFAPACLYTLGIHPYTLKGLQTILAPSEQDERWLSPLRKAFDRAAGQIVAIGETGFDHTLLKRHHCPRDVQMVLFRLHSLFAHEKGLPLILHYVGSADLLNQLFKSYSLRMEVPHIIHGFRRKPEEAKQLLKRGFYLSFGPKFNPESLRLTPDNRLFLETDADAETSIEEVYRLAAEVRSTDLEHLKATVRTNAVRVFGIPESPSL